LNTKKVHQVVNKEEVTFVDFQIEDQLCSGSERRDLTNWHPHQRETDEAAQAELETEAEAASSSKSYENVFLIPWRGVNSLYSMYWKE
jgi:hypothetical protein